MPHADPEVRRAYLRQYKATMRAMPRPPKPVRLRPGQWAGGHSERARCLSCERLITSAPAHNCMEPKHTKFHESRRAGNNKYRRARRAGARARGEVYRNGTAESKKAQTKRAYLKRRAGIIKRLGGFCAHCGFRDQRALQVHHSHGGGSGERKALGWKYHYRIARMATAELLATFKLLCANCHAIEHSDE